MSCSETLYPALGRHFKNQTELAHAGCMSRVRLWSILTGQKEFTRAEKKAISAHIIAELLRSKSYDYQELTDAMKAYEGDFDEIYKRKTG